MPICRTSFHVKDHNSAAARPSAAPLLAGCASVGTLRMIVAVAVLGQENNPLYLRTFGEPSGDPSSILRFHFIVHAALDHVEEKMSTQRQSAVSSGTVTAKPDMYLGFLYPIEEYRVYGYVTNSRVKLIIVLDDEGVRDSEMRALFRRLHTLYVDTISNPFYKLDSELNGCSSFEKQVGRVVEAGLY